MDVNNGSHALQLYSRKMSSVGPFITCTANIHWTIIMLMSTMTTKCHTNMVDETVVAHTVYQVVLKKV